MDGKGKTFWESGQESCLPPALLFIYCLSTLILNTSNESGEVPFIPSSYQNALEIKFEMLPNSKAKGHQIPDLVIAKFHASYAFSFHSAFWK